MLANSDIVSPMESRSQCGLGVGIEHDQPKLQSDASTLGQIHVQPVPATASGSILRSSPAALVAADVSLAQSKLFMGHAALASDLGKPFKVSQSGPTLVTEPEATTNKRNCILLDVQLTKENAAALARSTTRRTPTQTTGVAEAAQRHS